MLSPCDTHLESGVLSHCIQSAVIMLRNAIVTRCSVNRAINRESVAQTDYGPARLYLLKYLNIFVVVVTESFFKNF